MRKIVRGVALAGTIAIAALIAAAILGRHGEAQTGKPVITRSWPTAGVQSTSTTSTITVKPAIVRDLDNPDRQTIPSLWTRFGPGGDWRDGFGGCGSGFPIPTGARIIIEAVSVRAAGFPSGQYPYISISVSKSAGLDTNSATFVPLQQQGIHLESYHYVATQSVHLIVEKDDWLCEQVYSGPDFKGGPNTILNISYLGYQIAAP